MFTVGELSRLTGVTVRALHHYDEIGLVRPSQRTAAGYRLYDDRDVVRLQRVLVYRELGLSLEEIAAALDGADAVERDELLRRHREALIEKRARIDRMLAALDAALTNSKKGKDMTNDDVRQMFDGFDPARYEDEVRERWGQTGAYEESRRRTRAYSKADWERIKAEGGAIYQRIADRMKAGAPPTDPEVQAAVEDHRLHIDRCFYPCSKAMHQGLGQMYVADSRFADNLDQVAPGFARFLSDAISAS